MTPLHFAMFFGKSYNSQLFVGSQKPPVIQATSSQSLVGCFNHLEQYEFVNGIIPCMKWKINNV